jgi:hypothetical protein
LVALLAAPSWGDEPGEEIPQVGRPADIPFSEASGSFRIETDVDREIVPVDDPIVLTIRIVATGPVRLPPQRLALADLPAFSSQFRIEDLPDVPPEAQVIGLQMGGALNGLFVPAPPIDWEFNYRLRPRSTAVPAVPDVPLAFFNPKIQRFQVQYADAIPIEVRPRAQVELRVRVPDWASELATGPAVRETWQEPSLPPVWSLLIPPLACLVWYGIWRWCYPNLVRVARQRRSRAARQALRMLKPKTDDVRQGARLAGAALTQYLHLRHDLPFREPAPDEVADHLRRLGCSPEVIAEISGFYSNCAAARFQSAPGPNVSNLKREASRLILTLEEQA